MTTTQRIVSGTLDTFVDGNAVSAEGTSPAPLTNALNPKMRVIQSVVDNHADLIDNLQAQIITLAGITNIFNVKSSPYNAAGNGIANDTTAIQNAVTDACAVNGIVVFPAGEYKITSKINVTAAITITASSAEDVEIIQYASTDNSIFSIVNAPKFMIENVTLKAYGSDTVASTGLIYVNNSENVVINNCTFKNSRCDAIAIYFESSQYSSVRNCEFIAITLDAGGYHLNNKFLILNSCNNIYIFDNDNRYLFNCITLTGVCSQILISDNNFSQLQGSGIINSVSLISDIIIQNNKFIQSQIPLGTLNVAGIKLNGFENVLISSNSFDLYTTVSEEIVHAIIINANQNDVHGATITQNIVQDSIGIKIEGKGNYIISDNSFQRCYTYCIFGTISSGLIHGIISNNLFTDFFYDGASTGTAIHVSVIQNGNRLAINGNVINRGDLIIGDTVSGRSVVAINYRALSLPSSGIYDTKVAFTGNNFIAVTSLFNVAGYTLYYQEPTGFRVFSGTAAPTTGTWLLGDKVLNSNPTPSGYIGWVCTTAGTSGTWKGFGTIQT